MESPDPVHSRRSSVDSSDALSPEDLTQIQDGLRGTGFLLEHRVHERFRSRGHNAFLRSLYVDPHTAESREMDIIVRDLVRESGSRPSLWASVVAECKAWANPIVVIGQSRQRYWAARGFEEVVGRGDALSASPAEIGGSFGGIVPYLGLRSLPSSVESADFMGGQLVLLDRQKGGYKAENSSVNQSAFLPLVKAMRYEQEQLLGPSLTPDEGPPRMVVSFPILVTSGPVIEAEPTGRDVEVREVRWTRLVRKMMDPKLPPSAIIEVVREDAVDEWIETRMRAFVDEVTHRLSAAHELFDDSRILGSDHLAQLQHEWLHRADEAPTD